MIKIGSSTIKTNIFLAPMSGCTDYSFRLIAREHGAKFCFFEMVEAKALLYQHPRTLYMLKTDKTDSPIAAQLLGSDPEMLSDAAQKLLGLVDVTFLDINSACPAKKVTSKGAGAYLLQEPKKLGRILLRLSSFLPVPVTVKIRIGYGKKSLPEALILAKTCQESGASAVFVHGRTRAQGYAGEVDYESIREIKTALKIPVFGSGNVLNPQLAKKMFDETGCDGILVARGALGYPWIFKGIDAYLKNGKILPEPTISAKKKVLKKHLKLLETHKGSKTMGRVGLMLKIAMWYLKGVPDAGKVRSAICATRSYKELVNLINNI
ncbi:MAG: tRNA dihydrouridine synthase DusB [Candidatus Omnitrophota bacterium]